jgi:hypothetical protein
MCAVDPDEEAGREAEELRRIEIATSMLYR